jgi:hypothetical protein
MSNEAMNELEQIINQWIRERLAQEQASFGEIDG